MLAVAREIKQGRSSNEARSRGGPERRTAPDRRAHGRERDYFLTPRASRPSFAAFSASACLPSLCRSLALAAATFAVPAAASKRLPTAALISFTSFGHWKASTGLATMTTRALPRSARVHRVMSHLHGVW